MTWVVSVGLLVPATAVARGTIVFDTSAGIQSVRSDGSGHKLVVSSDSTRKARHARWSPDGRRLVYHVEEHKSGNAAARFWRRSVVMVVDRDGSNRRRLAAGNTPRWSKDGRNVIYRVNTSVDQMGALDQYGKLRSISVATGKSRSIAAAGEFSPDGKRSAYWAEQAPPPGSNADAGGAAVLRVTGVEVGGDRDHLVGRKRSQIPASMYSTVPIRWVSNRHVAYACYIPRQRIRDVTNDVCLVDIETGKVRHLYPLRRIGLYGLFETEAAVDPSGKRLIVAASNALYTMTTAGKQLRILRTNPGLAGSNAFNSPDWTRR